MKKIYLILTMLLTSMSFGQPVITAIVDGTCSGGTPKMIEIFAQGQVDFSQYAVQKQSNGGGFATSGSGVFDLSVFGTVENDYVYIYNAADETAFLAEFPSAASKAKQLTGFASGNGDDAFRIVDSSNNVIDIYGVENEDGSGKFWEYLDSFGKRNAGAPASATMVQADWTFGGANFLDGKCGGNTFEAEMGGIQTYYVAPAAGPYFTEDFENGGTFPSGWTLTNGTDDWQIDDGTTHGPGAPQEGSYCAYFNDYDFSSGTTADMVTPTIDLSSATNPELTFWYWDSNGSDTVEILVSTNGTNFTNVFTTPSSVTSWTEFTVDLTAYAGQPSVNIAFRGTSVYGITNPHVDNIKVAEAPSCLDPTGLTVDSVTMDTATLSWTDAGGNSGNYKVEYKADGTSTWAVASSNATSPYTITGLSPATTYNWQLTKDCGNNGSSSVVQGPDFTTECAPVTALPTLLDFENVTPPELPTCISVETTTNATWKTVDAGSAIHPSIGTAHSGNNVVYFNSYNASSGKEAKLISPNVVLPNTTNALILSFYMYHDSGYSSNDDRVQVQVFDGTNWADVGTPISRNNGSSGWIKESVDISTYANQTVKIALNGISGYGNNIFVDDIMLKEVTCPDPTSVTVDARTSSTIDLSWTAGGSETNWKIAWGVQGFTPDFSATTNVADVSGTPSYQITGLTEATDYDVYLMADCGGGDTSEVVGPISVATLLSNNDCANALNLTVYPPDGTAIGNETVQNTQYAADSGNHPSCDDMGTNLDLFYTFTVPANTTTVVMKTGGNTGSDIEAALYDTCGGTEIACLSNGSIKKFEGLTPGNTYTIQAWHDDFNAGEFDVVLYYPPTNDECSNAINLDVYAPSQLAGNETTANTSFATAGSMNDTSCDSYGNNIDLFYTFTVPAGETSVKLITGGNTGDLVEAALYDSCGGTEIACFGQGNEKVFTGLTGGNTYTLQVWHDQGSNQGEFTLGLVAPINDDCDGAIDLTVYPLGGLAGNELTATTANATASQYALTSCDGYGTNLDLFYTFTVPAGETDVVVYTGGAAGADIELALYDNCGGNEIFCMDNNAIHTIRGLTSGAQYVLQVWHDSFNAGEFTIGMEVAPPLPANDVCSGAESLTLYDYGQSAGHETQASTTFVSDSGMHPSCDNTGTNLDLFYKFLLPPNQHRIKILTAGDKGDKIEAAIYDSCGGAEIACEGPSGEKIISGLAGGQEYILQVWHDSFNAGDFNIALEYMPTPPANDVCSGARTIAVFPQGASVGNETIGDTNFATDSGTLPSCANSPIKDYFYKFTLDPNVTDINVITSGDTGGDLKIALYDSCGGNEIVCEAAAPNHIIRGLTGGNTYYLQVWHEGSTAGFFKLGVEVAPQPPINDNCDGAIEIPVSNTGSCGNSTIATNEYATDSGVAIPSCSSSFAYGSGGDVWFKVTVPNSGAVTINTTPVTGSDVADTVMAVYSGDCNNLTEIGCNDDNGTDYFSTVELTNQTPGDILYVRVYEYHNNSFGEFGVCAFDPNSGSIEDHNIAGLKYYPNPVRTNLNISAQTDIQKLVIYDVTGKQVMEIAPNKMEISLDIRHLKSGVYFVKAMIGNQLTAFEFIKK